MLKMDRLPNERLFRFLERLAEEGFLGNNRQLIATLNCSRSSRFGELICSMKNLEELDLLGHEPTPDVLAHVFQSCAKLIKLHIGAKKWKTHEMDEHKKNQLISGFQRLRCLDLKCFIDSDTWPVIQEILTLVNR
jgi:hypothetical protein